MKKLIYICLFILVGCGEPVPYKFEKTKTYIDQIESCEYLAGSRGSTDTTIIKTKLGGFPVYGHKICLKDRKAWIRYTTEDKRYLEVEGENGLWEIKD